MTQHDDRGVVRVFRAVVLVVAVEPDARPDHRHAAVRFGRVEDHLVLAVDPVQPRLERRVGAGGRFGTRLPFQSQRGQSRDSRGRRGGKTTEKSTPVHAKPPSGETVWDRRHRVVDRLVANRSPCPDNRVAGAR